MTGLGPRLRATAASEWIKLWSVRSVPGALAATAAAVLLGSWILCAGFRAGWSTMSPADQAAFDPTYTSIRGIELAQLFIGALGAVSVTGEYGTGLIRATFTATPQRAQVLAAKALIFGAVVWAQSTLLSVAAFFLGQSLLGSPAPHVTLADPGVLRAVLGGGVYLVLIGLLGLALGVLLRRTAAALAALFGIVLVLPLVVAMLPGAAGERIGEYLPEGAGEQLWHVVRTGGYVLGPWQGAAVCALYVVLIGGAALAVVRKSDV